MLENISSELLIEIIHVDNIKFNNNYKYEDIISPFSRFYYIKEGNSKIVIKGEEIEMKAGNLYLIPSFTPCSYYFENGMNHYFIHCILSFQNGINPFLYLKILKEVKAEIIDALLFIKIFELHPDKRLPDYYPKNYHKTMWHNKNEYQKKIKLKWESDGIVKQIFSRFIEKNNKNTMYNSLRYNIEDIFFYIRENLNNDISVQNLAEKSFLSTDHFSKVFKNSVGIGPKEYIIRQRLEKAQMLLLTTDHSMQEIISYVNFKSLAYFSRIFKKYNTLTPTQYRKYKHPR
tara:strand:+ start:5391 stop:6254 length:864 start_codon:yes stop_codon:yes gene_type:complete